MYEKGKKMKMKAGLLKELMEEMMDDSYSEMEREYAEPKMKATIMSDSEEGMKEGAEKLEEVMSKADKYKKLRMKSIKKD